MPAHRIRLVLAAFFLAVAVAQALSASPSLTLSKTAVSESEKIVVTVANAESPAHKLDWIGLYEEGIAPSGHPPSIWYEYLVDAGIAAGNGSLIFDPASIDAGAKARYGSGRYKFILAYDDGYRIETSASFAVSADQGAFTGASPFYLVSGESAKAMNLSGAESADYTPVILWDYDGSANEEWRLVASEQQGWYYIVSRLNYLTIAVDTSNDKVCLLAKGPGDNFLWRLARAGGDTAKIESKYRGKRLRMRRPQWKASSTPSNSRRRRRPWRIPTRGSRISTTRRAPSTRSSFSISAPSPSFPPCPPTRTSSPSPPRPTIG